MQPDNTNCMVGAKKTQGFVLAAGKERFVITECMPYDTDDRDEDTELASAQDVIPLYSKVKQLSSLRTPSAWGMRLSDDGVTNLMVLGEPQSEKRLNYRVLVNSVQAFPLGEIPEGISPVWVLTEGGWERNSIKRLNRRWVRLIFDWNAFGDAVSNSPIINESGEVVAMQSDATAQHYYPSDWPEEDQEAEVVGEENLLESLADALPHWLVKEALREEALLRRKQFTLIRSNGNEGMRDAVK